MNVIVTVDPNSQRALNKALADYAATTSKSSDDIVNTAAMHLCIRAATITRHADAAKIAEMKTLKSVTIARPTKAGNWRYLKAPKPGREVDRRRQNWEATPAAFLIYMKRQWMEGKNPRKSGGSREQLMQRALRMVNARISSVHYLRSGWLEAAKYFKGLVKSERPPRTPRRKKGQGGASVSVGGRGKAWVWNTSLYSNKKVAPGLVRYGKEGLMEAMRQAQAKLEAITADRIRRAVERFSRL